MTTEKPAGTEVDSEFEAMRSVYLSLRELDVAAQNRVLDYVFQRLGLKRERDAVEPGASFSPRELAQEMKEGMASPAEDGEAGSDDELAGVSPVALKWIRRNGLTAGQLSSVFSLGLDDIDLVARSVPGKNKKEKMRNVLLLSGAAGYLGTGAARADDDKVREALGHYNAYDGTNFASYMKDLSAEVAGTKGTGYSLTARGLAAAAELIKSMAPAK